MSENITFCENCRADVEFLVTEKMMNGTICGEEYSYYGKEARCVICDSVVFDADIMDYNLESLYDVYRTKNGIVSLNTVRSIPEKYAIGKRPLSLLLGWGEQTFSRYYNGDIPSKTYSSILMRVYDDPSFFAELLESGKHNLKSQLTYEKSRKAVDLLLAGTGENISKIELATNHILSHCEDITPLAR